MIEPALELPSPEFAIRSVEADAYAPTPTLRFAVEVTDTSGREIYTIAVSAQVRIDADRRAYDQATRGELLDLFGEEARLPATAGAVPLGRVDALVPNFTGACTFAIDVPVSADLELAAGRYLASLNDGAVPLTFDFNGTIFYRGDEDRLQVTLVPWSCSARHRFPVATWRGLIEKRYAASGFVRLNAETLAALRRRRAERGLPTLEATIADALE